MNFIAMDVYDSLSSSDSSIRLRGFKALLEHLKCLDGDLLVSELDYAIRRLIRGLASGRECVRVGFSATLAGILINFYMNVKIEKLFELADQLLTCSKKSSREEKTGVMLGRLVLCRSLLAVANSLRERSNKELGDWIESSVRFSVKKWFCDEKRNIPEPLETAVSILKTDCGLFGETDLWSKMVGAERDGKVLSFLKMTKINAICDEAVEKSLVDYPCEPVLCLNLLRLCAISDHELKRVFKHLVENERFAKKSERKIILMVVLIKWLVNSDKPKQFVVQCLLDSRSRTLDYLLAAASAKTNNHYNRESRELVKSEKVLCPEWMNALTEAFFSKVTLTRNACSLKRYLLKELIPIACRSPEFSSSLIQLIIFTCCPEKRKIICEDPAYLSELKILAAIGENALYAGVFDVYKSGGKGRIDEIASEIADNLMNDLADQESRLTIGLDEKSVKRKSLGRTLNFFQQLVQSAPNASLKLNSLLFMLMYLCRPAQIDKTVRLDLEMIDQKFPESFLTLVELWLSVLTGDSRVLRELLLNLFDDLLAKCDDHQNMDDLMSLFLSAIDPESNVLETKTFDADPVDFGDEPEKIMDQMLVNELRRFKEKNRNEFSEQAYAFRLKCLDFVGLALKRKGLRSLDQFTEMIGKMEKEMSMSENARYSLIAKIVGSMADALEQSPPILDDLESVKQTVDCLFNLTTSKQAANSGLFTNSIRLICILINFSKPTMLKYVSDLIQKTLLDSSSSTKTKQPSRKFLFALLDKNPEEDLVLPVLSLSISQSTSLARPHAITQTLSLIQKCWTKQFVSAIRSDPKTAQELVRSIVALVKNIHEHQAKEFDLVHSVVRNVTADTGLYCSDNQTIDLIASLAQSFDSCETKSKRYVKQAKSNANLLGRRIADCAIIANNKNA